MIRAKTPKKREKKRCVRELPRLEDFSNLLGKEAKKNEIFKSDHDCGRNSYCFGIRCLCSTQGGSGYGSGSDGKINPASEVFVCEWFCQKGQVVFDLAFFFRW